MSRVAHWGEITGAKAQTQREVRRWYGEESLKLYGRGESFPDRAGMKILTVSFLCRSLSQGRLVWGISLHVRLRAAAKLLVKAFGEIRLAAKADLIGDFRDGSGVLFEQFHGARQPHGADKLAWRLIGQRAQLAMKL